MRLARNVVGFTLAIASAVAFAETTLFTGSVAVPSDYMGMHYFGYPANGRSPATTEPVNFVAGVVRNHNYNQKEQWKSIETSNGTYAWTSMDSWVTTHKTRGSKTVWTFYGTPSWATSGDACEDAYGTAGGSSPVDSQADVSDFITTLVTRYNDAAGTWRVANPTLGKGIDYIEIWNEPNFNESCSGFWNGTAAQLATMGKTVYQAAKAVDSSITVLSPAFVSDGYADSYLAASDGASGTGADWMDGLAMHFYSRGESGSMSWSPNSDLSNDIATAETSLSDAGITGTPIYDTEHGMQRGVAADITWFRKPDKTRAEDFQKLAIYEAMSGIKLFIPYAYEATSMSSDGMGELGWEKGRDMICAFTQLQENLPGKTITSVVYEDDGNYRVTFSDSTTFTTGQPCVSAGFF